MTRRDKIHHIRELEAQIQRERASLATSVAGLSRTVSRVHPGIVLGSGVCAGFAAGSLLRLVRRGPLRRVYRTLLLARAWAVRLSLSRLFAQASKPGAGTNLSAD